MAIINALLVASKRSTLSNTPEIFYTSPSSQEGTVITNFTVTNDTGTTRSYKAYIVLSGGSADTPIVPNRNILTNRTDNPTEMAGQFIPPGATLQMESDAVNGISFTVSGREKV